MRRADRLPQVAKLSTKTNATQASHSGRIVRGAFWYAVPPLGAASRRYQSDCVLITECATFTDTVYGARFEESSICKLAVASGQPGSESGQWRRPQCPGNQRALTHASDLPPAIHGVNYRSAAGAAAIVVRQSVKVQRFRWSYSAADTLGPQSQFVFLLCRSCGGSGLPVES
jgi:hypothetical protein